MHRYFELYFPSIDIFPHVSEVISINYFLLPGEFSVFLFEVILQSNTGNRKICLKFNLLARCCEHQNLLARCSRASHQTYWRTAAEHHIKPTGAMQHGASHQTYWRVAAWSITLKRMRGATA